MNWALVMMLVGIFFWQLWPRGFPQGKLRTYSFPLKTVARPSKSYGSRTQAKLPAFAKSKGTVTFRLNYSQSYAITKMQLGRSLWREERHSVTFVLFQRQWCKGIQSTALFFSWCFFLGVDLLGRRKKKSPFSFVYNLPCFLLLSLYWSSINIPQHSNLHLYSNV